MVFNATFTKPEYTEITTELPQDTDNFFTLCCIEQYVPLAMSCSSIYFTLEALKQVLI
jgi:hypothetical protein